MPLVELLEERFRRRIRAVENPVLTSIGTTALQVLSNNPNRLGWTIVNLSTNVIYLSFANDVASTKGIRLDASGASASAVWDEDFILCAWAVWGVASGAASAIYAVEIVEY